MEPSFEEASQLLDQALLSYSGGQIEVACRYMAEAAAMLHDIQFFPPEPQSESAALEPIIVEFPEVAAGELQLALAAGDPAPVAIAPVNPEAATEPPLVVAA